MTSAPPNASELLRPGLLSDVSVLLAGADVVPESAKGRAAQAACAALGARVAGCESGVSDGDRLDAVVDDAAQQIGGIDLLAVDGESLFAAALRADAGGHAALRACVDGAWNVTRAVANRAFLTGGESGGRIVYIAPPPDAGEYADAARAGLENLARTLSIEWARHRITTVAIAPCVATTAEGVATLVAYVASPAGAYFSGCQLDLRGA